MLEIGKFNILKVNRLVEFGAYLDGGPDGEILLPVAEEPEDLRIGDTVEAFIYLDSEDRLIASMREPKAQVGEFACLKIVSVQTVGAFLDWGLAKDLFLPHAEQTRRLRPDDPVVVFVYVDKSGRIAASMRLQRHSDKDLSTLKEGQAVDLMIIAPTDLGFTALINGRHIGVLYKDEVFRELRVGDITKGSIKKLREDGKIDLILSQPGHKAAEEDIGPRIIALLKERGGFLDINDKTSAERIYELFGVSKKKYKIALGGLYKKRLIQVDEAGIKLVE